MQERRLFPRYPWERAVELCGAQGRCYTARASDISVAGIGLSLSRDAVTSLAQGGGSLLGPGDHLIVLMKADSAHALPMDLRLHCRVKEVRRVSRDSYVAGTWFEKLDPAVERTLGDMVEAARKARWGD